MIIPFSLATGSPHILSPWGERIWGEGIKSNSIDTLKRAAERFIVSRVKKPDITFSAPSNCNATNFLRKEFTMEEVKKVEDSSLDKKDEKVTKNEDLKAVKIKDEKKKGKKDEKKLKKNKEKVKNTEKKDKKKKKDKKIKKKDKEKTKVKAKKKGKKKKDKKKKK